MKYTFQDKEYSKFWNGNSSFEVDETNCNNFTHKCHVCHKIKREFFQKETAAEPKRHCILPFLSENIIIIIYTPHVKETAKNNVVRA